MQNGKKVDKIQGINREKKKVKISTATGNFPVLKVRIMVVKMGLNL